MAEYTENYNLKKPAQEDFYNVDDFNNNTDIIDSQLKAVSDKATSALPSSSYTAADILNKLKTVDGNGSGLDTDLFKGKSVIPVANGGTGATTAKDAFAALGIGYGFPNAIQTHDNVDLNTLTINGFYFTSGSKTSTNKYHLPENVYSIINSYYELNLIVYGLAGRVSQIAIFPYNGASYLQGRLWTRTSADVGGLVWTDWLEIATDKSIANMVQSVLQTGGVSVIKSIQRGYITLSSSESNSTITATISPVNVNKAIVVYAGMCTSVNNLQYYPQLVLVNSTTISLSRYETATNGSTVVPYQVIEFY